MDNEAKILEMLGQLVQGQADTNARLDRLENKVDKLETKMEDGFDRLDYSINAAAKDIGRLEKKLNLHVDQPIH